MGSTIVPPPGSFETTADCTTLFLGSTPCFIPGMTPKYVEVVVDGLAGSGTGIILIAIIINGSCKWQVTIGEFRCIWWGDTGIQQAILRLFLLRDPIERSFAGGPSWAGATYFLNKEESEHRSGDWATVAWGPPINEAAFLAQFP